MTSGQLQSHFQAAVKLLDEGSLDQAYRSAELAVDDCWKFGNPEIVQALPLYAMLRHATGIGGDLFKSLDDMPAAFSSKLLSEAMLLHERRHDKASSLMLADVNRFLKRWGNEQPTFSDKVAPAKGDDEKVTDLILQIEDLKQEGKRDLALETTLQLANEYAHRGNKRRAYGNFMEVLRKSKQSGRTSVRIDALLDFGQFMSRLGKLDDARRVLRLGVGVAKKARDKERFAHLIAALGIVLMHAGEKDGAKNCLKKANAMLSPWDLDADIVKEHLEALKEDMPCGCPEATDSFSVSDADWE